MFRIKLLSGILSCALCAHEAASTSEPTHLCPVDGMLVPCIRLAEETLLVDRTTRYLPTMWIPLWPNQSIWGVLNEGRPVMEPHKRGASASEEEHGKDTIPYSDENPLNVQNLPISQLAFGSEFVDFTLPSRSDFTTLAPVQKVFRGSEVFDHWIKALTVGTVCNDRTIKNEADLRRRHRKGKELTAECAFARMRAIRSGYLIEYCRYKRAESAASELYCAEVAKEIGAQRLVHAARHMDYVEHPPWGGGELATGCDIPTRAAHRIEAEIIRWIRSYVGGTSSFSWQPAALPKGRPEDVAKYSQIDKFTADGMNIYDAAEKMFLRVYLRGELNRDNDSVSFSIEWSFTISAQATDDITNYREPNPAMSKRLAKRMEGRVKSFVRSLSSRASCDWEE
ncbi:MAG: hypothetical protein WCE79_15860 [Xanthobacteraceae bacterium]